MLLQYQKSKMKLKELKEVHEDAKLTIELKKVSFFPHKYTITM